MAFKFNPITGEMDMVGDTTSTPTTWGSITGDITNQSDLIALLDTLKDLKVKIVSASETQDIQYDVFIFDTTANNIDFQLLKSVDIKKEIKIIYFKGWNELKFIPDGTETINDKSSYVLPNEHNEIHKIVSNQNNKLFIY